VLCCAAVFRPELLCNIQMFLSKLWRIPFLHSLNSCWNWIKQF
jgi:hypothetical protein